MSIKKILIGLAVALAFGIAALFIVFPALSQGPALPPGEYDLEAGQYVFTVPELVATPVPDTPVPPSPTPDQSAWHSPLDHEHGDAPPQWVLDSPLQPAFSGPEAHAGFKGLLFDDYICVFGPCLETYLQVHIFSVPGARLHRLHTFKLWVLDSLGEISYFQGSMNSGDPAVNRYSRVLDPGTPGTRILCADQAAFDLGDRSEQWYTFTHLAGPHINWLIGRVNYLCDIPEDPNPATWTLNPDANHFGLGRTAEVVVIPSIIPVFGEVYCVGGQSDADPNGEFMDCANPVALPQYAAPSLNGPSFQVHQVRQFACPDCEIPN